MSKKYGVTFVKNDHKKRKVCTDGFLSLLQRNDTYLAILHDNNGDEVVRKTIGEKEVAKYITGAEVTLGMFTITIETALTSTTSTSPNESKPAASTTLQSSFSFSKRVKSVSQSVPISVTTSTSYGTSSSSPLIAQAPLTLDPILERHMHPHQVSGTAFLLNALEEHAGAVLADAMGLGKTLTSIAVLWAYIKGRRGKGIIVCPSSLVDNWKKEISRWLPYRLTPICIKASDTNSNDQPAEHKIQAFVSGTNATNAVVIISYEMFRKHVAALNGASGIQLLVCDEGHRLKNSQGTKTSNALISCVAARRLIVTGTPLQNDLTELHAVVSFATPKSPLGSPSYFQSNFISPILCSHASDASPDALLAGQEATARLNEYLSKIFIRRTQTEVLKDVLPLRREWIIFCGMSKSQREAYDTIVKELEQSSCHEYLDESSSCVLPILQNLRTVCNANCSAAIAEIDDILLNSNKMQVLEKLLSVLFTSPETKQSKVVIVSNFTATLDLAAVLAQSRGYGYLRLDGSTPVDARQHLVDRFNRVTDCTPIFLLSARAGGMGINLIGANILIMLDFDWNPAVDNQAMARVWREGQKKEVFVYRLLSYGTLEHSIRERQVKKEALNCVLDTEMLANGFEDEPSLPNHDTDDKLNLLTRSEMHKLVYPDVLIPTFETNAILTKVYQNMEQGVVLGTVEIT